ncbi:HAD-IA family hydrolase [Modestobacter sp. I12A-02628]|uniref:HAD-IA family hydrolase n=1 Tax=Goekera deserti TaxID=2497753 RepID=A0A7K3WEE1_9ACTN|nr:HAD-IA family hydrolase [Goekera deserti]MPQ98317.1 HAD-IA family hydrolase [Goekera deserti]NDI48144.1 HAD-IA family hydrolase [Goekera deserti]NEL53893.1 HAD-IA family hydrolase [Goekera deserti]
MKDHPAPHHSQARGGPLQDGLHLAAGGVLFDNDGVLVDSDAAVAVSWARWAHEHDLDPGRVIATVHGRRSADTVATLVPRARQAEATRLIDAYELEDSAVVTALPGAAELLPTLPAERWAVVTSGSLALASARLRAAGLPLPAVLVTAEDVERGKPDPQGYQLGARRLGLPVEQCLVVEDSAAGVAAGLASGAAVLGVSERALGTAAPVVVRDLGGARWVDGGLLLPSDAVLRAP